MIRHSPQEIALINYNLAHYQEIFDRFYPSENSKVVVTHEVDDAEATEE